MSDVYAVFNELALNGDFPAPTHTKSDARTWMENFSKRLYEAEQSGVSGLRTFMNLYELSLVKDYSILEWIQDDQVDETLRLRLQTIFTSLSKLDEFPENQQGDPLFECQYEETTAYGIGAAYLLESFSISLPTGSVHWQSDVLPAKVLRMHEETLNIDPEDVSVVHICDAQHIKTHSTWLRDRLLVGVPNGKALLSKSKKWYPHLIFCAEAQKQLKQLKGGALEFRGVIRRLFELENYCKKWNTGGFNGGDIPNSSGESSQTMQQYGRDREFVCPDGNIRTFEYHLKGLPNAWRIHIWADEQSEFGLAPSGNRKILVGYVGKHLPTVNDPT